MSREQPNYYAIIPAEVRYDKDLQPSAKLLYGEITALANKDGYCWAGNTYFSELYGVTTRTVTDWIGSLIDKGYIHREIKMGENNQIEQRRLYIIHKKKTSRGIEENLHTLWEKTSRGIEENFRDNNTINNTLNNTTNNYNVPSDKSDTPTACPHKEIISYLNEKANKRYNHKGAKNRKLMLARWNEGYTLEDFKKVIDNMTAEWKESVKMNEYLRPSTLFGNKFDQYLNKGAGTLEDKFNNDLERFNEEVALNEEGLLF